MFKLFQMTSPLIPLELQQLQVDLLPLADENTCNQALHILPPTINKSLKSQFLSIENKERRTPLNYPSNYILSMLITWFEETIYLCRGNLLYYSS